jgi:hypothetical protein
VSLIFSDGQLVIVSEAGDGSGALDAEEFREALARLALVSARFAATTASAPLTLTVAAIVLLRVVVTCSVLRAWYIPLRGY